MNAVLLAFRVERQLNKVNASFDDGEGEAHVVGRQLSRFPSFGDAVPLVQTLRPVHFPRKRTATNRTGGRALRHVVLHRHDLFVSLNDRVVVGALADKVSVEKRASRHCGVVERRKMNL